MASSFNLLNKIQINRIWEITNSINNNLFKSSFNIIVISSMNIAVGFAFWALAARLYSKEDIGLAISLIGSIDFIILVSRFGLDQSLIRFLPVKNEDSIFSTSIIVTTSAALLIGIIFLQGINIFAPKLSIIRNYYILYLLFLFCLSIISLTTNTFIAMRKSRYYLIQNIVNCSKLILLYLLVPLGILGIFNSVGISYILASLIAMSIIRKMGLKFKRPDKLFLKESFRFSISNFIALLLMTAPNYLLPIMILSMLNAEESAHYFIAYSISSILIIIPSAFSMSLLVEGSHGESMKENLQKTLIITYLSLGVGIGIIYIFGEKLLGIFGSSYVGAFELLKVISLSTLFIAICRIYISVSRVEKNVKSIVFLNLLIFILLISLSYIFANKFGLVGIGYAWVISYGINSFLILIIIREKLFKCFSI